MGLFHDKEEMRHKREIDAEHEKNAIGLSEKLLDSVQGVAYEPQVSNRILETNTRLLRLNFSQDGKYATIAEEDRELREPIGDDALGFTKEDSELHYIFFDIDTNLASIREMYHKYKDDNELRKFFAHEFNEISAVRQLLLNDTRLTGKPSKLAKSQYVESNTNVSRQEVKGNNPQQGNGIRL